jgi:hypothetical protein
MAAEESDWEPAVRAWASNSGRLIPSGAAVAAMLSAMLGMLALAIVNLGTTASEAFERSVHEVGKLWMPGAEGIGPYSGKETLTLLVWLVAWAILHPALKKHDLSLARWLIVFLVGLGAATTLIWPPMYGYLAGH